MRISISRLTPLCALLIAFQARGRSLPPEPAAAPSVPSEAPVDPGAEPVRAAEIWQHPANYLGQTLSIEVQMHSEVSSWNPMLTRFGPDDYRAFRAWSDEQFPWIEDDFRAPLLRLFARRGSAAEWALDSAPIYARFELLCCVTATFAGVPWVEVLAVKPRPRSLDEGSVIHATRGTAYLTKGAWKAAAAEFERASLGRLPLKARVELERLSAICSERSKPQR